ncbi:unnamed protein product [Fraxinus pennsylvanica]|uniref:EamA domain-containing protein n=1 Tax=Fraxinus pennsylvanica TaxID=56036 RepID=A0AAD2DRN6_9LAMI|nr:unnamed protein product [Fraxinus pennsylvanica]
MGIRPIAFALRKHPETTGYCLRFHIIFAIWVCFSRNKSNQMAAPPARARADYDYLIKLLLIGDSGVGKSCLLLRFSDGSFTTSFITTIGIDFKIRTIELDGKRIKLQIWDTAGQERFRTITTAYYRGAMGILLVYDVTDESSFNNIRNWIRNIEQHASDNVNKILVGNKADMDESKRAIPTSRGQALADEYGIKFFETSAKTNMNVEEVFFSIGRDIKQRLSMTDSKPEAPSIRITQADQTAGGAQAAQKSACCATIYTCKSFILSAILENASHLPLANLAASVHGLHDTVELLAAELGNNVPSLPQERKASLLIPPSPILCAGDWPLLMASKGIFEGGLDETGRDAHEDNEEAIDADWGETLDIGEVENLQEEIEEGGWDLEDLDLPPKTPKTASNVRSSVFVTPTLGMPIEEKGEQKVEEKQATRGQEKMKNNCGTVNSLEERKRNIHPQTATRMDVLSKAALNEGMSNYVFVVYRHAIATIVIAPFALILDKKMRPKMTLSIFGQIMLLGLLEPVIDQNLYFLGMKYTTATFAAAMCNILPAITLVMACFLRLEKFKVKSIHSQAKLAGTLATVAGAMLMTLLRGPVIELPWTKGSSSSHEHQRIEINLRHSIKGSLMITIGCFCWACFMNLQAITLRTYPAELSLTVWICLAGTAQGGIVALVMERGKAAVWAINWDTKFLAAAYSGIFCSGIAYYIQGLVMKERGPVFVTAFSPLGMIIVAVLSSFILAEQMFLGRVVGAIVIVMGLYLAITLETYPAELSLTAWICLFGTAGGAIVALVMEKGKAAVWVVGAIVIVISLYLVIWGKKKDYKSPQVEEEAIPVKKMIEIDNNGNEHSNCEVININMSREGAVTRVDHALIGAANLENSLNSYIVSHIE